MTFSMINNNFLSSYPNPVPRGVALEVVVDVNKEVGAAAVVVVAAVPKLNP